MKKWIVVFASLFLLFGALSAQQVQQVPQMRVQGESKIFQMPDIMEVNVEISTLNKEYKMSVEENFKALDQLKRELKAARIKSLVIKDVAQRVNEEKSYQGGKTVTTGYRASYRMILQVDPEGEVIHKLLKVLRRSGVSMNYNAAFKLSPELLKSTENRLIQQAVKDAMGKAEVIAEASQTNLNGILAIEYGAVNTRPGPLRYMEQRSMAAVKTVGEEAFTQPDPIELTDRVVITWKIK
jgi:uncharacterized protein YggE